MATFEIKMPKLGESITEGTIISWSVKTGDSINEDDVLFEVSTAKVSAEIPSPVAGKVLEILFQEGDTVAVGTTVAVHESFTLHLPMMPRACSGQACVRKGLPSSLNRKLYIMRWKPRPWFPMTSRFLSARHASAVRETI